MYLYIIGFHTPKHLIVRTFATDLDDVEILESYYADLLEMRDVCVKQLVVDDTFMCNYNSIMQQTLQQFEFKRDAKGYWLFKPGDTNAVVNAIVDHTNNIFDNFKREDALRTEFSKFARENSIIVRKTAETESKGTEKPATESLTPELEAYYALTGDSDHGRHKNLYFMAPSALVARAPSGGMFAIVPQEEELERQPTKEGFGNILVFENLLTNTIKYKVDNNCWTETLRDPKLSDAFPEIIVYASHLYRKTQEVEMLIHAYLKFNAVSSTNNTEDIFVKLESILGIDNLKRECAEGTAFGIPQEICMTKAGKYEHELISRYSGLLLGGSAATNQSLIRGLQTEALCFFVENCVVKYPEGQISLRGFSAVVKKWLTEYLNTTPFGRFSTWIAGVGVGATLDEIISAVFAHYNISVDDETITGCVFSDKIISSMCGSTISINDQNIHSMYFEYSILIGSGDGKSPVELTEYLFTEIVKKFFEDAVEDKADSMVPSRELWAAFTRYLQLINCTNITQRLGQTEFTPLCKTLGFEIKRSAAGMMWKRIALKPMFTGSNAIVGTTPITTIMSTPVVAADVAMGKHADRLVSQISKLIEPEEFFVHSATKEANDLMRVQKNLIAKIGQSTSSFKIL